MHFGSSPMSSSTSFLFFLRIQMVHSFIFPSSDSPFSREVYRQSSRTLNHTFRISSFENSHAPTMALLGSLQNPDIYSPARSSCSRRRIFPLLVFCCSDFRLSSYFIYPESQYPVRNFHDYPSSSPTKRSPTVPGTRPSRCKMKRRGDNDDNRGVEAP